MPLCAGQCWPLEEKGKNTHSRVTMTLTALTPTMGSKQYPSTEVTRKASMGHSDMRLSRMYNDMDPKRPTP